MQYECAGQYAGSTTDVDYKRIRQLQDILNDKYTQAAKPGLSWSEQRALDKEITALECEIDEALQNKGQAKTPGGYYTSEGVKPATGSVVADPALVLGEKDVKPKAKPLPWILLVLAAGTATYFTVKG